MNKMLGKKKSVITQVFWHGRPCMTPLCPNLQHFKTARWRGDPSELCQDKNIRQRLKKTLIVSGNQLRKSSVLPSATALTSFLKIRRHFSLEVNQVLFSVDHEHETNWKRPADRPDSHITPHPLLSWQPTGRVEWQVMISFLKWQTMSRHWGSWSVCCCHSWGRSYLKCFVISLALVRRWHARHKHCIGGEFQILLTSKRFSSEECLLSYDLNACHVCLH